MWWILLANFKAQFFPVNLGLKFVTENFTTFFTSRKKICHLELTLGSSSPKISAQSFSDRMFLWTSARHVRVRMLVFQNLEGLTEVLAGCPQGHPAENFLFGLTFSFLILVLAEFRPRKIALPSWE